MNLAIDIGNTCAKLAVIENGQVVDFFKTDTLSEVYLEQLLENFPDITGAILISVHEDSDAPIEALLRRRLGRFIRFGHGVPVPIRNGYATPDTLGADRLAAAVGAATLYPGNNVLIVDFGTAITFDFVSAEGEFLGGNISPGAATRFRALHHFTRKLPLCELIDREVFMGRDTVSAIEGGIVNGIVYEVEGYIRDLERKYDGLRIIFTGGDSNFFANRVKKPIFATYDLVAYGLNRILEYNAK